MVRHPVLVPRNLFLLPELLPVVPEVVGALRPLDEPFANCIGRFPGISNLLIGWNIAIGGQFMLS